ncbi:hypothetical protein ACFO6R_01320 [Eubacterium multiforme]|uniref:Uncharacterized protein n=1 Tax=Eubacterium multiforme TaxID=83339 RepID=A0ABT9UPN4_9FIRM|nr:hypothetical protein [Eubacterium multiforme]MDQ0148612.1 hypothetical protein [Eubacterium multiforme]
MFNRKVLLELTDVYYNMDDLLKAVKEYYRDQGTLCRLIGRDNLGNPLLLINLRTYELKVKNITPGGVQCSLSPKETWPQIMGVQQIILKEI